jgi:hypothetical protein
VNGVNGDSGPVMRAGASLRLRTLEVAVPDHVLRPYAGWHRRDPGTPSAAGRHAPPEIFSLAASLTFPPRLSGLWSFRSYLTSASIQRIDCPRSITCERRQRQSSERRLIHKPPAIRRRGNGQRSDRRTSASPRSDRAHGRPCFRGGTGLRPYWVARPAWRAGPLAATEQLAVQSAASERSGRDAWPDTDRCIAAEVGDQSGGGWSSPDR